MVTVLKEKGIFAGVNLFSKQDTMDITDMFKIPLFGLSSVFYTSCTKKEPYLFIGKTHKFKNCLNLMTLSAGFAFLLLLCLILRHKQFIIFTVHLKQFFMRTTFQNLTICNIHNAVRIFNCRQTMCNNKRGTSL